MPLIPTEDLAMIGLGSMCFLGLAWIYVADRLALQREQLLKGISVPVESLGDRELWALGNRIDQENWWRMKYAATRVGQQQQKKTSSPTNQKAVRISEKTDDPFRQDVTEKIGPLHENGATSQFQILGFQCPRGGHGHSHHDPMPLDQIIANIHIRDNSAIRRRYLLSSQNCILLGVLEREGLGSWSVEEADNRNMI
ncbi:uncharacterized protein Z520_01225 [Fonsecaea multimorphosa CBS 102226]|uniref:Uncharacterized protein n=1 Tax=Fonsecaea multimorphosa CBS 102226 TaxID=1442371 RepID=A0A0D2KH07_9EURO|nr:uncharacterized protein Z520_01225 [Fonsecaea multimorphosa CBS 102226]KIY02760.1 hypothetical protein Z520_01225 [Fonsecaea multimorphosa CBS 102226]OAL31183.1 hypothetical protein AYO22_01216 [Fonsecaea multimorphosa]